MNPLKKFKPFNESFPYCSFGMALANVYPNTNNIRKRVLILTGIVTFCGVQIFWFFSYTMQCLLKLDIVNFARNITLWIVVILFFFKTIYAIQYTKDYKAIVDTISSDYIKANEMEEDYQKIYEDYLKKSKFGELVWAIVPILLSSQFPLYAAYCMISEQWQSELPKRYMVHEMEMIYVEDIQYETPFFEIYFAYNITQCIFLVPIFMGFDGSFCIATTHLCLKLKLMTHRVHRAFKYAKNSLDLRKMTREAIIEHQEVLQFYKDLHDFYGPWLLAIFFVASLAIAFNLYLIYMAGRIEPKYVIFMLSSIIHIYLPCWYASNVTQVAEETAWDLYSAPWEVYHDPVVTYWLIFMIARAQEPMVFTGKGLVIFDLKLFISIMQSAYSFYTLIVS